MVAGENAETTGIIGDRFVKSKLGRKISDRSFDRGAGSHFPVGILACEIISENIVDLLQLLKKGVVLREFFQTRLARELEHTDGIVIGPIPKIWVEMTEEAAGRRLPRPPEVEGQLPKRLQRSGKGRDYVIGLKCRHERQQRNGKVAKNSWAASFSMRQLHNAGQIFPQSEGQNAALFGAMSNPMTKPITKPQRWADVL